MRRLILLAAALALVGCAQTSFKSFETAENNLFLGRGGTKEMVDGMEVWDNGEPPRHYKVIGYVEDQRPDAPIQMLMQRRVVVMKARDAGGDAVVQVSSSSQLRGFVGVTSVDAWGNRNRASAFGTSVSAPMIRNSSRFAVIKYVEPGEAARLQPTQAPPGMTVSGPFGSLAPTGAAAGGPVLPPRSGATEWPRAEALARSMACHQQPVVTLSAKGPGFETYSVPCANGDVLTMRCEYGSCRSLR